MPEHWMQTTTPRFSEHQSGLLAPQSAHEGLAAKISATKGWWPALPLPHDDDDACESKLPLEPPPAFNKPPDSMCVCVCGALV